MFSDHSTTKRSYLCRFFQTSDQPAVQQLILNGLKQRFGRLDPRFNRDLADITTHYINHGATFLVLYHDTQLIGCGALTIEPNTQHTGRIERVSISPSYQGQSLGTQITQALIAHGRRHGFTTILVETNDDWYDALHLYQKLGFIPYKHENGEIHMSLELVTHE